MIFNMFHEQQEIKTPKTILSIDLQYFKLIYII